MKKIDSSLYFIFILFFATSCVEPFDAATENFEDILVVEATITNEFKFQEVNLRRTFKLEDVGNMANETGATVLIKDNLGNTYRFSELYPGQYRSESKFKISVGNSYQLFITTANGNNYTSTEEEIFSEQELDKVYVEKTLGNNNNDGMTIYVDSFDPSGKSKYYRYEYTEVYKHVPPYAFNREVIVLSENPAEWRIESVNNRVCYRTIESNSIIQTSTNNLSEDRVTKLPLLFIKDTDYKTGYRYSILVKQYVQTLKAYTYYKTLGKFSNTESVFSQVQTGFLPGNVFSENNREEKVIGFFEVTSVSSERIYFNFRDIFPRNKPLPRYFMTCTLVAPDLYTQTLGGFAGSPLIDALNSGDWVYYADNTIDSGVNGGPLILVETACGDCRALGSNIKPDYWID